MRAPTCARRGAPRSTTSLAIRCAPPATGSFAGVCSPSASTAGFSCRRSPAETLTRSSNCAACTSCRSFRQLAARREVPAAMLASLRPFDSLEDDAPWREVVRTDICSTALWSPRLATRASRARMESWHRPGREPESGGLRRPPLAREQNPCPVRGSFGSRGHRNTRREECCRGPCSLTAWFPREFSRSGLRCGAASSSPMRPRRSGPTARRARGGGRLRRGASASRSRPEGPLPVVLRTRGDRALHGPPRVDPLHRPASWSVAVDGFARAAPQRRSSCPILPPRRRCIDPARIR
jgi:hypothetical protein